MSYPNTQQQQFQPQFGQPPAQGFAPQQGFVPQQQQGFNHPPAPEQPQLAAGSLDAWAAQPTGGHGPSLQFQDIGAAHLMVVARPITDADVSQQTDTYGRPQIYNDGKPKFVLKVPVNVPTDPQRYTEGKGQWYCQGTARNDLAAAMAIAGAPAGPPESGAVLYVKKVDKKKLPNGTSANVWQIQYIRPGGEAQGHATAAGIEYPTSFGNAVQTPAAPATAPIPTQAQAPAPPVAPPVLTPPVPVQAQAPAPPAPPAPGTASNLDQTQQELLATLIGQR